MLERILEPELMDTAEDASEYDAMDHRAVNAQFVTDLLAALTDWSLKRPVHSEAGMLNVLDLGAGTAQIPIELARRAPNIHITAIDAAESMLAIARKNIAAAGLNDRIQTIRADAKQIPLPCREGPGEGSVSSDLASFDVVISNSIIHHIADSRTVLAETIRVTAADGLLFHRDLVRPNDESELRHLVETYAGDATPYQRKLFADSLRAALTLDEIQNHVACFGFAPNTVQMTSDRHWTWAAMKK